MNPQILLDTHIAVRWLVEPKRLSIEQSRMLREAVRRNEVVAISAFTLIEIALLYSEGAPRIKMGIDELFRELETSPVFVILPLTIDIAREFSFLAKLRDPADRVIVATARVHGLRLLTSDQRIIESNIVSTVE